MLEGEERLKSFHLDRNYLGSSRRRMSVTSLWESGACVWGSPEPGINSGFPDLILSLDGASGTC